MKLINEKFRNIMCDETMCLEFLKYKQILCNNDQKNLDFGDK